MYSKKRITISKELNKIIIIDTGHNLSKINSMLMQMKGLSIDKTRRQL